MGILLRVPNALAALENLVAGFVVDLQIGAKEDGHEEHDQGKYHLVGLPDLCADESNVLQGVSGAQS